MHANDWNLTSFVAVRRGSHFPIQNLPYGRFSTDDDPAVRPCVAIGAFVLDLRVVAAAGALELERSEREIFESADLARLFALGSTGWRRVRAAVSALLRSDNPRLRDDVELRQRALVPMSRATLHLPVEPPGFTDFYASKAHATNVGRMFRDARDALFANWVELPVAYNGRASSVVLSGTPVRRPNGQMRRPGEDRPHFGPTRKLDFELEMAAVVGTGNLLGEPIGIDAAESHIFGLVLLNDWSARDLQQWESQPLGPFAGKSFATSISPWIVTLEALESFRIPAPLQEPEPLEYLCEGTRRGFDIALDVALRVGGTTGSSVIARSNFKYMYWTIAQQLAHHTACGCSMRPGDLLGSGTVSGPDAGSLGCLLELTADGTQPLALGSGESRTYLADGDEVTMTGFCEVANHGIGFGEVCGRISAGAQAAH